MKGHIFKFIFTSATVSLMTFGAAAQNIHDALRFSREDLYGTARSMAMGNALTAIGGDIGALPVNPASTGIYRYSEFEFTPGVDSYVSDASFAGNSGKDSRARFSMASVGYVGYIPTRNRSGLKNINWSISTNQTGGYLSRSSSSAYDVSSSWLGSKAYDASVRGINSDYLNFSTGSDYPWDIITAYQSYQINNISGYDDQYVANTENIVFSGSELDQRFFRESYGYTHDINLNAAANISDKLFIGLNLTIQSIYYNDTETFHEQSINPDDFETGFSYMTYSYNRSAKGVGFKVQAGVIYRPVAGLSLGASISTPAWKRISERWTQDMDAYSEAYRDETQSCKSPYGETSYNMTSPFKFNLGAGYTIGRKAVISADYTYMNYGSASFSGSGVSYGALNDAISEVLGTSHTVRVGAEVRVTPVWCVRAGYNYISSPLGNNLFFGDDIDKYISGDARHLLSAGFGYRNDRFFFDVAYQQHLNYVINYLPYDDYCDLYDDYVEAPTISETLRPWKLFFTIGFKF